MSGFSEETDCPKCGGLFHRSMDNKDYEGNYGFCLECGFSYAPVESTWTLEQVNEEREGWELPPLKKLKPQKK